MFGCLKKKAPRSLFLHLVLILLITAVSTIVIVFGFFHLMRSDAMNRSFRGHLNQYAGYLAAEIGEPPDQVKMRELSEKLQIRIIYRPYVRLPDSSGRLSREDTKTLPDQMRDVSGRDSGLFRHHREFHEEHEGWSPGHFVKIYRATKGIFVFVVNAPDTLGVIPRPVFALILLLLFAFFVAWLILRKLVLPLKKMEEAFAAVSGGDLSVNLDLKQPRELASIGSGFNRMLENIRKMLESRQQMLRDVSHDLRTPLTRIKIQLGFLKKSKDRTAIENDVRIMEGLLAEILESYRLSGDNLTLESTEIDLRELTDRLVQDLRPSCPGRKIVTEYKIARPVIIGDEMKIPRLFSNLLDNAIKYSPENSMVKIVVRSDITHIIWEIHDKGKPLPDELSEKIFEPFFQAESSRNAARNGYGLGLYIARKIAEDHGGSIEYRPEKSGSIFVVRLPVAGAVATQGNSESLNHY